MSRYVLACLVVVTLLTGCVLPQNVYADEIENPESYLYTDEKAFVASFRSQASQVRADVANIRGLLAMPKMLDDKWYTSLASYADDSVAFCGLTGAPESMQVIAELWQELVCARLLALKTLAVQGAPRSLDIAEILAWLDTVNGLVEGVEASVIMVEAALDEQIAVLAEDRHKTEEAILPLAGIGDCFIATAAYGTPAADEIDVLRQFRDEFLEDNAAGRAFVDFYYEFSPPIADFISEHEAIRIAVREGFVDPVVNVVDMTREWWAE